MRRIETKKRINTTSPVSGRKATVKEKRVEATILLYFETNIKGIRRKVKNTAFSLTKGSKKETRKVNPDTTGRIFHSLCKDRKPPRIKDKGRKYSKCNKETANSKVANISLRITIHGDT
jgi:hypothetical protein